MDKINFINQSTPALNATNLNKLQDNVEDAIGELETTQNNKVKTAETTSNTDTYSCNYINDTNLYSTTETKTNKKWIDGKDIYRKVVNFTIGNINTDNLVNIGTFDTMVSAEGYFINSGVQFRLDNVYVTSGNTLAIWIHFDGANGYMHEQHNYNFPTGKDAFVVLEYTKN